MLRRAQVTGYWYKVLGCRQAVERPIKAHGIRTSNTGNSDLLPRDALYGHAHARARLFPVRAVKKQSCVARLCARAAASACYSLHGQMLEHNGYVVTLAITAQRRGLDG